MLHTNKIRLVNLQLIDALNNYFSADKSLEDESLRLNRQITSILPTIEKNVSSKFSQIPMYLHNWTVFSKIERISNDSALNFWGKIKLSLFKDMQFLLVVLKQIENIFQILFKRIPIKDLLISTLAF